jgi:zinc protease
MDVLSSVLSSGRSSRLYRKLLVEQGMVQEISAYQMSQQYGSVFLIEALPAEGHTVEEVEEAVAAELALLATEGPTEEELARVKNNLNVGFLQSLESLQSRASALNRYRVLTGDPDWVDEDLARYEAVSIDDVKAAAASLNPDRRGILRVRPEPSADGEEN